MPKHAAGRNPVVCAFVRECGCSIGRTGVVVSELLYFMLSNKCIRAKRDPGGNRNRGC